jgi:DNA helicase IV
MQVEAIARDIGSRFDHVLVDEYQDTNRLQASILVALKPDGKGLTVVGDDAQSIYSFRADLIFEPEQRWCNGHKLIPNHHSASDYRDRSHKLNVSGATL